MASFSATTAPSLKPTWVALLVVIAAAVIAPHHTAEAVISCNSVLTTLSPCLNFVLVGGSVPPPTECCYGVKSVINAAATKEDRQAVCSCLKSVAGSATPSIINNAAELPGKCGVSIPYVISPSTDCSRVS